MSRTGSMRRRGAALTAALALAFAAGNAGDASAEGCVLYPLQWKTLQPGAGYGLAASGDHVFVARGAAGVTVVDASVPGGVILVTVDTPGNALDVAVQGTLAFVADGAGGLRILNISDPMQPSLLAVLPDPAAARCVAVQGSLAFVGDGTLGLVVVDVADPSAPQLRGSVPSGGAPAGLAVSGSTVFVADENVGLLAIAVADPDAPAIVGAAVTPGPAHAVALRGTDAFVACGGAGVTVVDVALPSALSISGSVGTPGTARDVFVAGDAAYVADSTAGLATLDVTVASVPVLLSSVDAPWPLRGVAFAQGYAYTTAAGAVGSLDPLAETPAVVGTVPTGSPIRDLAASGAECLVLSDSAGLQLLRVDGGVPRILGSVDPPGDARGVGRSGNFAYLAMTTALQVVDLSDPAQPVLAGSVTPPGGLMLADVDVHGHHAIASDNRGLHQGGLVVFDVAVPTAPAFVTYVAFGRGVGGVEVEGDYLYCVAADGLSSSALWTVRITNPATPSVLGSISGFFGAFDAAYGRIAIQQVGTIRMYTLADPAAPAFAGSVTAPCLEPAILANVAYVSTGSSAFGLQVLDVADPATPAITGALDTAGPTGRVDVSSQFVFLADGPAAVTVARLQCDAAAVDAPVARGTPGGPRLGPGAPNPFRGSVSFALEARGAGPARLDVYDVLGRHVRTLRAGGAVATDVRRAEWNGADDSARPVAPGVYFVRLSTPDGEARQRVTRLR